MRLLGDGFRRSVRCVVETLYTNSVYYALVVAELCDVGGTLRSLGVWFVQRLYYVACFATIRRWRMSGRVELGLTRRTAILAGPMVSACLSRTRSKSWAVHITLGDSNLFL